MRALVLSLVLLPAMLAADVVTEMTPERIREAIAFGTKKKSLSNYPIGDEWNVLLNFSTPFLRVAQAAAEAASTYRPFGEADVTPDLIEPEIRLNAVASIYNVAIVSNVRAVVIVLPDGRVIQPSRVEERIEDYQNRYGAKGTARSLIAYFPLSVVMDGNEVRVVRGSESRTKFDHDAIRKIR